MEEFLFSEHLRACESKSESTSYLEILTYSDPNQHSSKLESLSLADDFDNFLTRRGVFAPPKPANGVEFRSGLRLVLQYEIKDDKTFFPDVISLPHGAYESLLRKFQLPFRAIETSSVVGPFFWWAYNPDPADRSLQFVFRKSDVQWKGRSRGWEMIMSYSFQTGITSGFFKGTDAKEMQLLLRHLRECSREATHPFLLPILVLSRQLSSENDKAQRETRDKLRDLENKLSLRYPMAAASDYVPKTNAELDKINFELTECQCKVLWKRPQAWRNVVDRVGAAATCFWDSLADADRALPELQALNRAVMSRLNFLSIKLDGLESYAHVSLERLHLQRQVMDTVINQRESRLSLLIAAQQGRLAEVSRRDSASMKTLTLMGATFLPGTFLASIFSMTFFDFSTDMEGSVSGRLWIYFAVMVPLTALIMSAWWMLDRHSYKDVNDENEIRAVISKLETQALRDFRQKTGVNVMTGEVSAV